MTNVLATPLIESAKAPAAHISCQQGSLCTIKRARLTIVPVLEADRLGANYSGANENGNNEENEDGENFDPGVTVSTLDLSR